MRRMLLGMFCLIGGLVLTAGARAGEQEDVQLARSVARNLKTSGQLQDYRVRVSVQDGMAWLDGEVQSARQAAAAEQIARQTLGSHQIENRLLVAGQEVLASQAAGQQQMPPAAVEPTIHTVRGPNKLQRQPARSNTPLAFASLGSGASYAGGAMPIPETVAAPGTGSPAAFDSANMPGYAWPAYAAYPNYAALTYPRQYSPTAWPYIGPFYPYPQVPLGWRKVTLEWDDGWWMLDFHD